MRGQKSKIRKGRKSYKIWKTYMNKSVKWPSTNFQISLASRKNHKHNLSKSWKLLILLYKQKMSKGRLFLQINSHYRHKLWPSVKICRLSGLSWCNSSKTSQIGSLRTNPDKSSINSHLRAKMLKMRNILKVWMKIRCLGRFLMSIYQIYRAKMALLRQNTLMETPTSASRLLKKWP